MRQTKLPSEKISICRFVGEFASRPTAALRQSRSSEPFVVTAWLKTLPSPRLADAWAPFGFGIAESSLRFATAHFASA